MSDRALVISISTRAAAGVYADTSGPIIVSALLDLGFAVDDPIVVPDGDPVGAALREAVHTAMPRPEKPSRTSEHHRGRPGGARHHTQRAAHKLWRNTLRCCALRSKFQIIPKPPRLRANCRNQARYTSPENPSRRETETHRASP